MTRVLTLAAVVGLAAAPAAPAARRHDGPDERCRLSIATGAPSRRGRWVKLRTGRLTLAPGASRIVAFTVTVPRRVLPGQHLGGIVAQDLTLRGGPPTRAKKGGSFRIRIRNLSVVAVEVNLPGKRISQMSVTGVAPGTTGG